MDQIKIGKYINEKRKENNITQSELAEKLNITDRAVSKWENGICMPDSSIIPILCKILNITINDLFSGKTVDMKDKEKILENNLLELKKQKEEADKRLLNFEIIIGIITIFMFITFATIATLIEVEEKIKLLFIVPSTIFILIISLLLLRIEQIAGYYKCNKCNHKYIPTYKSVLCAMHINRTRYMKCPKCNKRSWHKKVL